MHCIVTAYRCTRTSSCSDLVAPPRTVSSLERNNQVLCLLPEDVAGYEAPDTMFKLVLSLESIVNGERIPIAGAATQIVHPVPRIADVEPRTVFVEDFTTGAYTFIVRYDQRQQEVDEPLDCVFLGAAAGDVLVVESSTAVASNTRTCTVQAAHIGALISDTVQVNLLARSFVQVIGSDTTADPTSNYWQVITDSIRLHSGQVQVQSLTLSSHPAHALVLPGETTLPIIVKNGNASDVSDVLIGARCCFACGLLNERDGVIRGFDDGSIGCAL